MPNDETGKPSSLSPWESKADDEVTFDKSTSPLENDEDEPAPMTSEIKVIRIGRDPDLPPKYPFETGQPRRRKPSRSAIHNGLLRSHRLQNFSHPSVISSTQQLLCLTPSRGVITLGSQEEVKYLMKSNTAPVRVKRFNEKEIAASSSRHLGTAVGIKPTGSGKATAYRLMQKDNSGPRSSSIRGHPLVLSNLHYKPTTQIRHPYRYTATSPASGKHSRLNATAVKTATQRDSSAWSTSQTYSGTAYRIIENHMKHNRKPSAAARSDIMDDIAYSYPYQTSFNFANPVTHARKMAPVLRVIPALPRTTVPFTPKKHPESPIETEPTSQKRVRFSDQIGLPLVRHATPNYRRKHSYILRWLETAGRQAKSMPSA